MGTSSNRFPAARVVATVVEVVGYVAGIAWLIAGILWGLQLWGAMKVVAIVIGLVVGAVYALFLKALAELIRLLIHVENNSFICASWLARIGESLQHKEGQSSPPG